MAPPASNRLAELDALRGIAALAVVLFHYTSHAPLMVAGIAALPWGFDLGRFGVHLFFAISGFVIFMTLERTRSAADFAVSRFARLFPAYWSGVALTSLGVAVLGMGTLAQPAGVIALNLTMLQGFLYQPDVDGVYWSLTVELSFYLTMLGVWRAGQLDRIERVLAVWLALALLWPWLPSRLGMVLCLRYLPWFTVGMLAYRVRQGTTRPATTLPLLALGWVAVALTGKSLEWAAYPVVVLVFAGLVGGRLRGLDRRALVHLGALSYPLYLVHQNLGYGLIYHLERAGIAPIPAIALTIAAALALAEAIHRLVEAPALAAIRAAWAARSHPAPAPLAN